MTDKPNGEQLWSLLKQLIRQRVTTREFVESDYRQNREGAVERFQSTANEADSRFEADYQRVVQEYEHVKNDTSARLDEMHSSLTEDLENSNREHNQELSAEVQAANKEFEEAAWMVESLFDKPPEGNPAQTYDQLKSRYQREREFFEKQTSELEQTLQNANAEMEFRKLSSDPEPPPHNLKVTGIEKLHESYCASVETARAGYLRLKKQWFPKQFRGWRPFVIFVILVVVMVPAAISLRANLIKVIQEPINQDFEWLKIASVTGLGLALLVLMILWLSARSLSYGVYNSICQNISNAEAARRRWLKTTRDEIQKLKDERDAWMKQLAAQKRAALADAEKVRDDRIQAAEKLRDEKCAATHADIAPALDQLSVERQQLLQQVEFQYPSQMQSIRSRQQTKRDLLTSAHQSELQELDRDYHANWQNLISTWQSGMQSIAGHLAAMHSSAAAQFPTWDVLADDDRKLPETAPDEISIGQFQLDMSSIADGIPSDERLTVNAGPQQMVMPALLDCPDELSVAVEYSADNRDAANHLLQAMMLRLLTSIPPGKLRFTIIDPVGLGDNFAAFMHLADYDEVLITNRIWTEQVHIEKRLADLTEHMENVFQTYLRNEFNSIREYNEYAGEVAEPYHFLVVANFPASFTERALRRFESIIASGPRCGVHVLTTFENKQSAMVEFDFDILRKSTRHILADQGRFLWNNDERGELPFVPDLPPDSATLARIVKNVGEQSKDARHVEVSFTRVAPAKEEIWNKSSQRGLDVPLGRAGATKLQFLRLGKGTSQHVMVAGKTGSGKSTFLHILITNLALHYSPDEVEFFLVDFKKGVEFKSYAANRLPHARVIAIESDREFGMSVLEKLDGVLKERGDLFRAQGVQDLPGYRAAFPEERMPRILLMVDEFQEFFVEDDQISQKCSLLLDRLVRQGRAFGIHVLLGSQTLGGAYSLARSTLGQVAVRIALQCSESDAHLILSEDNMAARLLSRPGEAIYNDANGLVEGNHPFQIAWLGDDTKEAYVKKLAARADEQGLTIPQPVVFEGNIPAAAGSNVDLMRLINTPVTAPVPETLRIWLGDPVSIKSPALLELRRQSGQNVLIVGQNGLLARGIFSTALIGLSRQFTAEENSTALSGFYHFSSPQDSPEEFWTTIGAAMSQPIQRIIPKSVPSTIEQLHGELKSRQATGDERSPIVLLIENISRFRDLRRDEDDFGFGGGVSGFGEKPAASSSKLFNEILREGPSVGMHTVIWSDTWNNVTRAMASQTIREFEMRVAFRMNPNDSTNMIDTPAGSRLAENRAILYRDDLGTLEKFRPYGEPESAWLNELQQDTAEMASMDDLDEWLVG